MKRDPKRIGAILANLRALWECEPELRFWQLIEALKPKDDPFYMEDDEALARLSSDVELPKQVFFVAVLKGSTYGVSSRVFSTQESARLAAAKAVKSELIDRFPHVRLRDILSSGKKDEFHQPLMWCYLITGLSAHVYARELDSGWE